VTGLARQVGNHVTVDIDKAVISGVLSGDTPGGGVDAGGHSTAVIKNHNMT